MLGKIQATPVSGADDAPYREREALERVGDADILESCRFSIGGHLGGLNTS